jgi:hypothetical protein
MLFVSISTRARAEESTALGPYWFQELGLSAEGGMLIAEPSASRGLDLRGVLGGAVHWGIFRYGLHRAVVSVHYQRFLMDDKVGGTQVVEISTQNRQIFGLLAGYDLTWRLLVVGGKVGMGVLTANTTSTIYEVENAVVGNEVVIDRIGIVDQKNHSGGRLGFLGGLSLGLDLGRLWGKPSTVDIRLRGEAHLRDKRQDFLAGLSVTFWPSGLWLN